MGGGYINARILFEPKTTAAYRFIVTTFVPRQTGAFVLSISPPPVNRMINAQQIANDRNRDNWVAPLLPQPESPTYWAHTLGLLGSPERAYLPAIAPVFYAAPFQAAEQRRQFFDARKHFSKALVSARQNRPADAEKSYRQAITLLDPLVANQPKIVAYRQNLAQSCINLAVLLMRTNSGAKDIDPLLWRALAAWGELVQVDPNDPFFHNEMGGVQSHLAIRLTGAGNLDGARAFWQQAAGQHQEAVRLRPKDANSKKNVLICYNGLADVLLRLGEVEAACQCLKDIADFDAEEGLDARVYCRCLLWAEKQNNQVLARQCGDLVVKSFERTVAGGFKDYFALWFDADFEPMKKRADFQKIYRDRLGVDWDKTKIIRGTLSLADPVDPKRARFRHTVLAEKLEAGKTYRIDLASKEFDPILRIEDAQGKQLAEDDDSADNLNARLFFTPTVTGAYRMIVTHFVEGDMGNFILGLQEIDAQRIPNHEKTKKQNMT